MKVCPNCKNEFEEGIAYCPKDGTRLTSSSKMARTDPGYSPSDAAAEQAKEEDERIVGTVVAGRYKILKRLGEGGMGTVYRAEDTRLEKQVAIKILKEDFAHREDVVKRFTLEAKSAARIKHENVLDVTDYGETEDHSFYIAMELLVGTDLADVLQKNGSIELHRALGIMIQVTRALGAAHAKGIVHRDLKPENIFLVPADDGREVVKIVDFGIAQMKDLSGNEGGRKLTKTGMIFGTPEYMSPEQAAGKSMDHRVDVYAVGVILYEILAGRTPYVGDSFMGILSQHMFEPVPPIATVNPNANVSPELEAIVFKALAKDPSYRYQSMQELGEDLVRLRDGQRPTAVTAVVPGPPQKPNLTGAHSAISSVPSPTIPETPTAKLTIEKNSGSGRTAAIGAIVLLLVGAAGYAVTRNNNTGGGTVVETSRDAGAVIVAHATPDVVVAPARPEAGTTVVAAGNPAPDANVETDAEVVVPSAEVEVQVTTTPSARIEVAGDATRGCAQTPCRLTLLRGREVRLIATAARKRGERAFTPERANEEIVVAMSDVSGGHHNSNPSGQQNPPRRNARCRPGEMQYFDPVQLLYRPCPTN